MIKDSRVRLDVVEKIPVPERVFFFRSCTGSMEYPGLEKSIREITKILGIKLVESWEQTCCSGYLMTCQTFEPITSLAVTARNLSIAEREGLDVYTNCNGCFGWMTEFKHFLDHNGEMREKVDKVLAKIGCTYQGTAQIRHFQELWYRLRDRIKEKQVRSLDGLPVGIHYGCHYLAKKYDLIDDPEYPTFQEDIVEMLGGKPVFYRARRECCGAAVGTMFTHMDDIALPHAYNKLKNAKEEGVELLLTVCPGCNVQLDRSQIAMKERGMGEIGIPVIDLSQLIAWTLGVPGELLGFHMNSIPVVIRKEGRK
ncbi:MAG: CoB--CoM heterodisulfide reductase iron-sulfur subunit B family protein [Bacillota bacterium]|nr:CoB--CoM heterodisulfide reductase iron-sulfur subunit B family protein [Bacillota bacterium]